jgi:uncharacterized membrane protein
MERALGRVLRIGIRASTVCMAVGLLASFVMSDATVSGWLMTIGLLALMGTPAARVVVSVVEYAIEREWTFLVLTSLVLLELCLGIVAALLFHRRL